ncbi:putative 21 kDa protein [Quillaja saponaria]|uniref:21 kDa protein n=1 Tax=Quillaja saponaria TaxID=32244 RepID=A0AAD7PNX6_QUISA|nr:putative 21 kDa protein [Quillaja saponaria]
MAQLRLSLPFIILCLFCISGSVEPAFARQRPRAKAYIEAACRTTRYPSLCFRCLSGFANSTIESPQQLAQIALSVSLYKALYTRSYVLKVAKELKVMKADEYQTVNDCLQQINDSVDQLSESIKELRRLDQNPTIDDQFLWHISNVYTWVSAALTDASSCVDEFPGHRMSKMKATIKGKVLNVEQVTSNALSLFHRYAARYKSAARATKKP